MRAAHGLIARCLVAALLFTLALAATARAQDGVDGSAPVLRSHTPELPAKDPPPPATTSRIRVQSSIVTTPVTVIDSSGEFVSDLQESDFKILDNGVPQRIERFGIAADPLALVIVVQTNDTVDSLLGQVRPLGPVFSDLVLGPRGQVAVMSFSDRVRLLQSFSSNRDRLTAALGHLEALGNKARLNDALMQAMALLENRPKAERRLIVAFSDGSDHGSENDEADVIRRATGDEVTIYGLRLSRAEALLRQPPPDHPLDPLDANVTRPLPPGVVPTPTNSANVWGTPIDGGDILGAAGETISSALLKNALEAYAGYTGGVYYSHWRENKLQDQLNRIGAEIHTQYEVAYAPTTLAANGFHRIRVQVARSGLRVRARAGYFYEKQ